MAQFQNLMEILKILPKTNCRKCNEKTCTAFAAAVFKGDKPLALCPEVSPDLLDQYAETASKGNSLEQDWEKALSALKSRVAGIDFNEAAERTGGAYDGRKLSVRIMGKAFSVDHHGNLYSDIHANQWVTMPILSYLIHCKGTPVSGNWVSMRELPSGMDWYSFFNKQCEQRLKQLADTYTDLFEDLVQIFDGKPVDRHFQSDVAVVLRPLPLVPLMVTYLRPEDGMDSSLSLLFDETAEENLGIEAIYTLGTGIAVMFEKLARRHG